MSEKVWKPDRFLVAHSYGLQEVNGYSYRGLGLSLLISGSPKGRRKPQWMLIHLGTGHTVTNIVGTAAEAFPVAYEIAHLGDWGFDSLTGWRDRDPEIMERLLAFVKTHPECHRKASCHNEEVAIAVATARAS